MKKYILMLLLPLALISGEFLVKIDVTGAHVGEIYFGCKDGATSGYDRKIDVYVPPQAVAPGHVGFKTEADNALLLYKDLRGTDLPQQWIIQCTTDRGIWLSWDKDQLPGDLSLSIAGKNGKQLDMKKNSTLKVPSTSNVTITARLNNAEPDTNNSKNGDSK